MGRLKEFPYDTHIRLTRPNEYYLKEIVKEHKLESVSQALRMLVNNAEILYREGIDIYKSSIIEYLKEG